MVHTRELVFNFSLSLSYVLFVCFCVAYYYKEFLSVLPRMEYHVSRSARILAGSCERTETLLQRHPPRWSFLWKGRVLRPY